MTATEERPQTSPAGGNGHLAAPERPALDVSTAIRTRRTIRRWTDDPVSPEIVKELLECALWAPSACNMQLWDFVVVTDPAIRQSLAEAVPFADKAQVCIFICYNTRFSEGSYANIQSASAAVMNMLLRAHSLGLGGFWQATIHDRQKLRLTLGLPKDVDVLSTTLFGYPAETPGAPARRDPSHLVHWEKYHPKPTLPSSPDPRDWRLDQIADYQQARIRAGPKYNKPIASEYQAVRGYLGHALRRVGADGPKAKVLDLLPCTGLYLEAIAEETEAELHFVELGQQVASFAQARLPRPATFHPYRGTIDLPDASIDAATCVFRLENLPPAERVTLLRETQRVLKPGGALILAHVNRGVVLRGHAPGPQGPRPAGRAVRPGHRSQPGAVHAPLAGRGRCPGGAEPGSGRSTRTACSPSPRRTRRATGCARSRTPPRCCSTPWPGPTGSPARCTAPSPRRARSAS